MIIESIYGLEKMDSCSEIKMTYTDTVNFECSDLSYNTFNTIVFQGAVNLTDAVYPLQFNVTFAIEDEPIKPSTGNGLALSLIHI